MGHYKLQVLSNKVCRIPDPGNARRWIATVFDTVPSIEPVRYQEKLVQKDAFIYKYMQIFLSIDDFNCISTVNTMQNYHGKCSDSFNFLLHNVHNKDGAFLDFNPLFLLWNHLTRFINRRKGMRHTWRFMTVITMLSIVVMIQMTLHIQKESCSMYIKMNQKKSLFE